MESQSLKERAASLRNAFCDAGTRSILRPASALASLEERKQAMAEESGITDHVLLDQLISLDLDADTVAAISLVPIIEVAWSDGELDEKERSAVLRPLRNPASGEPLTTSSSTGCRRNQATNCWMPGRAITQRYANLQLLRSERNSRKVNWGAHAKSQKSPEAFLDS